MKAEQITDPVAEHGEGPAWDSRRQAVRYVDMLRGDLLTLSDDGLTRQHVGTVAAAWRPRTDGGLVIAVERGFALWDDGEIRTLGELWADPSIRMNEGGCDPQGRFYCGSMGYDKRTGAGTLWRLDGDGTAAEVAAQLTIANGLEWSPDEALAYHVDTPTQTVFVCDFDADAGMLRRRRPFVRIPDEQGAPDGLTVDAEGGVWVALWGGAAVHRYTPDGRLDDVVQTGVRNTTACTFGGSDLGTLYITTSREELDDPEPDAGALFALAGAGVGRPPREFVLAPTVGTTAVTTT